MQDINLENSVKLSIPGLTINSDKQLFIDNNANAIRTHRITTGRVTGR